MNCKNYETALLKSNEHEEFHEKNAKKNNSYLCEYVSVQEDLLWQTMHITGSDGAPDAGALFLQEDITDALISEFKVAWWAV